MLHILAEDLFDSRISEGEVVLIEGPSFHNIVELSDYVIEKKAFPFFSITHGTYSKIKLNKSQLTTSEGLKIVSQYNKDFIGQFIINPTSLDLENTIIIKGNNRINELIKHLENNDISISAYTYNELNDKILSYDELELIRFEINSVRSKSDHSLNLLISKCLYTLRTSGLANKKEYLKRFNDELEILQRLDLIGMVLDVHNFKSCWKNLILRGSANNSLICFLLDISIVDPIRYNLPFERFVNISKIYNNGE